MKRSARALLALLVVLLIAPIAPAYAQESVPSFVLVSWNIQSSQSDPDIIAEQMALFDGVDIWVLQEVNAKETGYYRAGAEDGEDASFDMVMSSAGVGNHLLTLYDLSRFILMGSSELAQVNTTGNARPALVMHFMDIDTEAEFLVVNNHLYSSRANERVIQAMLLNDWTNEQTLPAITAGDFNFEPKATDLGFVNMTIDEAWSWIEPEQLLGSLPSGKLVDHVFTAGPAQDWPVSTQVVVREGDADSAVNADHKPVIALVGPEVAAPLIPCGTTSESCLFDELQPVATSFTGVTKSGQCAKPAKHVRRNSAHTSRRRRHRHYLRVRRRALVRSGWGRLGVCGLRDEAGFCAAGGFAYRAARGSAYCRARSANRGASAANGSARATNGRYCCANGSAVTSNGHARTGTRRHSGQPHHHQSRQGR